ncbi:hypothetical protein [Agrobacterium pusense]|uniref:hypothetical protein n=1 Tax=Agrobacterium pusense TaxID=648995 RepID=UPI000D1B8358|nr:hypothetical protein [Agrobacterium pusense]
MTPPLCKSKADRDRLRQRVGESRKAQLKEIHRQVKRWSDGAPAEDCLAAIKAAIAHIGERD